MRAETPRTWVPPEPDPRHVPPAPRFPPPPSPPPEVPPEEPPPPDVGEPPREPVNPQAPRRSSIRAPRRMREGGGKFSAPCASA